MQLSKIEIKNFKSFNDISLSLNNFSVLIGACASGKSNFIEIFKFLNDIADDFEKAISKHGGDYYLKNFKLNSQDNPCYLKVTFNNLNYGGYLFPILGSRVGLNDDEVIIIDFKQIDYELKFNFSISDSYDILNEMVKFSCNFYKVNDNEELPKNFDEEHKICENSILLHNFKGKIIAKLEQEMDIIRIENIIHDSLLDMVNNSNNENKLIINSPLSAVPIPWNSLFKDMVFYDFHPKLCKGISAIEGDSTLTEYGDNLPVILDNILRDNEKRRQFLNLITNMLPYIEDINVEKIIEERRVFTLLERYTNTNIPAPLISDGTSDIIALIVALYFEKSKFVLIEEPERNVHPALLSKIVQMMIESSKKKQIIITTHSPEILKCVDLKDIYLISRDLDGFSVISKPINNEIIKPFIEELGIDEVFIDDYLGLSDE